MRIEGTRRKLIELGNDEMGEGFIDAVVEKVKRKNMRGLKRS